MKDNKVFFRAESLPQDASPLLSPDSAIINTPPENRKNISRKTLINQLNYVHFNDGTILIKMKHKKYDNEISLEARPRPCTKNIVECHWIQVTGLTQKLQSYKFNHFLLSDGLKLIRVDATVKESDKESITLELPDVSYELSSRKVRRHRCTSIDVEFFQNGAVFYGRLVDFSPLSCKVVVNVEPPQTYHWIQSNLPANVIFKQENRTYYSGQVNIIRYTSEQRKRSYVLQPVQEQINRFKTKEFRCLRYVLNPSPIIIFIHPLTKHVVNLPVCDISGSGFSVEENFEDSVLIPGMIIPEIEIEIANNCVLRCFSQVIYRKNMEGKKNVVKCGITILDMDIQDQMKLAGILQRSNNKNTFVCNRVNIDSLWRFFFEAGFIYPQKYDELYPNKEEFKKIYEKLYIEHPQIARHFIYQERGTIHGHISMLRYFTNTWLFHHHASNAASFMGPGVKVLEQICQYVNDFYQHYSTHMNYIVCYYRANNRFPNRIFGYFAEQLNDAKGCSIYPMAYLSYINEQNEDSELPANISIEPAEYEDLLEMKSSIGKEYGNLIFHAFDFEQHLYNTDEVSLEYKKAGIKRQKHLYSIKVYGQLKAIFLVLVSEAGINLSNLTNCTFAFVIEQQDFSEKTFYTILNKLKKHYENVQIPVLIYPSAYVKDHAIQYEKIYNLWIFNSIYLDRFLKFMNKLVHET